MIEVIAAGIAIDVAKSVIKFTFLWLCLRILDWLAGVMFRDTYQTIRSTPMSAAVYHGLRFAGACILFAAS